MLRKTPFLLFPILLAAVFTGLLATAAGRAGSAPLSGVRGQVALMGSLANVDMVAQPFLQQETLQLLRTYPAPARYVAEAPTAYFPSGAPPDLALKLYEVTAASAAVDAIIAQIQAAAAANQVIAEAESLAWLSFLPQQFLVSGSCEAIAQVMEAVPGVWPVTIVDLSFPAVGDCAGNEQIWLYAIKDVRPVREIITFVNTLSDTIAAQPNHLIIGHSRDYIAGSPMGPIEPGATQRLPGSQPYTGVGVQLVIFDTTPFPLPAGGALITGFQGVSVTVSYPYSLPTDLPAGDRLVAGHGTFVANAIIDLAPDAAFHLVRVLNDTAIGDEFSWYRAMAHVMSQTAPISHTLAGMVFNYSFGLEVTQTASLTRTSAMSAAVTAVHAAGIVQVAAAGNDSAFTDTPLPMTWPARHGTNIGVTAVIWDDSALACYANQGEIAMWGGGVARGGACRASIVAECVNGRHPAYCVTGWDPGSATAYAYGMGTSYAAPQVAAIAAQGIESQAAPPGIWPAPDLIRDYIHNQVSDNPDPDNLQIGVIGSPYPVPLPSTYFIYLPVVIGE